jgi:hypothetical protein
VGTMAARCGAGQVGCENGDGAAAASGSGIVMDKGRQSQPPGFNPKCLGVIMV